MEKLVSSKLMKKDANKRIATVDRNIGVVRRISLDIHRADSRANISLPTGLRWSCP